MKNWLSVLMSLFTELLNRSAVVLAEGARFVKDTMHNPLFITITCTTIIAGFIVFVILPPLRFLQCNGRPVMEWQTGSSTDRMRHGALMGTRMSGDNAPWALPTAIESNDSIGVIINLRDCLLLLTCHGVVLRTCRFTGYNTSASWKTLCTSGRICAYLNSSFTLATESATIPKIPFTVKRAPRDTITAAKESAHDTCSLPKKGDIAISMRFNDGLTLNFYQSEPYSIKAMLISLPCFYLSGTANEIRQKAANTFYGKISGMSIVISIGLSHDDAGILYRAFPRNGKLVLLYTLGAESHVKFEN